MKREDSPSSEEKNKFVDDGRTLYDMSGLDDMYNTGPRRTKKDRVSVTREQRRALIRAAFARFAPVVFGVLACFTLAGLLLYFWLK